MVKPTPTQRDVLLKMREGWTLRFYAGSHPIATLYRSGEWSTSRNPGLTTCQKMLREGWITWRAPECDRSIDPRMVLTDAGREAIDG